MKIIAETLDLELCQLGKYILSSFANKLKKKKKDVAQFLLPRIQIFGV